MIVIPPLHVAAASLEDCDMVLSKDIPDLGKEVRAAFELDPRVDMHRFPIHVVSNGQGLRLEGEVENIMAKRVALRLAQRVSGMDRVIEALRLVPTEARGDGEIRDAFVRSLLAQPELRNATLRQHHKGRLETVHETTDEQSVGTIEFAVLDGGMILTGQVLSLTHKRVIEALAWWTPGCRDVVNKLEVKPAEEDNDDELADAIRLVFEMDPMVHADQITIRIEQGAVTLAGLLRRADERRMAEIDAWSVWGVQEVHNRIEVG
jgi:osmotically-inducible protein OsmY